jgi:hypothetical protein
MTQDIIQRKAGIAPMSAAAIANVQAIERNVLACPQEDIHTSHILHAGLYSRTIVIPAEFVLTGALIKIPTLLFISGDVLVSCGDNQWMHIKGRAELPARAGRKQAFITAAETSVTMIFPTKAATVEQAEAEFTDDTDILFSRRDPELNTIVITGE